MVDEILKRNRFYPGTEHTNLDHENDFRDYHLRAARLHHAVFHGWGIASGLELSGDIGTTSLFVQPGVAIDKRGELIVLANSGMGITGTIPNPADPQLPEIMIERTVPVDLSRWLGPESEHVGRTCYVTIEAFDILREYEGSLRNGRYEHVPWLRFWPVDEQNAAIAAGRALVLAIVTLDETGNVSALQAKNPGAAYQRRVAGQVMGGLRIHVPAAADAAVQGDEAGSLEPAGQGGLQVNVPRTSDHIVLTQTGPNEDGQVAQANFAQLEVNADQSRLSGDLLVEGNTQLDGSVSVGAAAAEAPLHITSAATDKGLKISAAGKRTDIALHVAGGDYGYLDLGGGTKLRGNGHSSTFSGNVGVGTATPGQELHVVKKGSNADVRVQQLGYPHLDLYSGKGDAGLWNYGNRNLNFATDAQLRMHITGKGQLILHTKFAYKHGGGSWSTLSDASLKRNIQPLQGSLEKLLQLRGVQFEWKEPEKQGDLEGTQIGFIAQEVEEVFPQWVDTDPDGNKAITTTGFRALTVEALRELVAEINSLKQELAELKQALAADE